MKIDYIGSIVLSITKVIKTMASIDIKRGKSLKKKGTLAFGDVTGVIGMVAPNAIGSLAISFNEKAVLEIMSGMLGETITEINEEAFDCVGELTNIVAGGAKKIMSEKGFEFGMASPVVISGKNHEIINQSMDTNIAIPFRTNTGAFLVEICYREIRQ